MVLHVFIGKNIEVDSTEETYLNHILLNSAKCCSPNVQGKSIAMAIGPIVDHFVTQRALDARSVRSKDAHKQLSRTSERGCFQAKCVILATTY